MSAPFELGPRWRAGTAHPKLDLRLAALLELGGEALLPEGAHREAGSGTLRRSGPLSFLRGRPDDRREGSGGPAVLVFLTMSSAEALGRLSLEGMSIRSRAGRMATAEVPLHAVRRLEETPEVVAVEWTGGASPAGKVEPAVEEVATALRNSVGDGRGVLLGLVDVEGLDLYHPDFQREDGSCRIVHLWDQAAAAPRAGAGGKTPAPWGYGVEYSSADIRMELHPNRRRRHGWVPHEALKGSHGTMVAGLAAGRGAEDPAARGVAPGAALGFVNTCGSRDGALAAMTEVAEALDFLFQRAGDMPCVANVSLGDELGPHDGTSPVERFIDELLAAPGRAVVIAAGNSGQAKRHACGRLEASGGSVDLPFQVGSGSDHLVTEVWFDAGPGRMLAAEVAAPEGLGMTSRVGCDGRPRVFEVAGTRVMVGGMTPYLGSENGLLRVELFVGRARGRLVPGCWTLRLFADGAEAVTWDAWLAHPYARWSGGCAQVGGSVTAPGTCRKAITVGACDAGSGKVCWFSGRGPGRRGVQKPELVAPGTGLTVAAACMSARYLPHAAGTSFAAPQVAGAAALLLARWGKMPAEEVKARLLAESGRGFGRLQVGGA